MPVDTIQYITLLIFRISAIGSGVETTKAPPPRGKKIRRRNCFSSARNWDDDPHTAASADDPRLRLQLSKKS